MPDHTLSLWGLFLQADWVVKGVMVLLLLASVAAWSVIVEKAMRLIGLRREVEAFEATIGSGHSLESAKLSGAPAQAVQAGLEAWRDRTPDESRGELRERIERAMRAGAAQHFNGIEVGLPYLATLGSTAPFVGLFGTVWGIMNSFTAIAGANDTSLAVVAPGIAEALFATAIGLAAAIPAVISYNTLSVRLGRLSGRVNAGISILGDRLSRPGNARAVRAAE